MMFTEFSFADLPASKSKNYMSNIIHNRKETWKVQNMKNRCRRSKPTSALVSVTTVCLTHITTPTVTIYRQGPRRLRHMERGKLELHISKPLTN